MSPFKQLLLLAALLFCFLTGVAGVPTKSETSAIGHYAEFLSAELELSYFVEGRHLLTGEAFDPGFSGFEIIYKDMPIPFELFSFFVLPGEVVPLSLPEWLLDEESESHPFIFLQTNGRVSYQAHETGWTITAPQNTGIYPIDFIDARYSTFKRIQLFVMVPADQVRDGWLNGFRIGRYPAQPYRGNPAYLPPEGFIEVTEANQHIRISPHFTLGQFASARQRTFPSYMVLQESLVLKLETILHLANKHGHSAPTFNIMSAFRTPWQNQSSGSGRFSRHIYGDAADFFIDYRPSNGRMDDLNRDGVVDIRDARLLYNLIDELQRTTEFEHKRGGLGIYGNRRWRGRPYIHVDSRGENIRWEGR